ncbi:hypothetical protein [Coralloluteibacterium stylophorae]|uniref:Uncharacterized protein n=1 Tax=Coralloluteibacterium stylophorae TaxID=1776034 RepID=A0A8J8B1G3_9GAMM|nr:hypothetical protein [Coralloluteibacterium stylophorae]MBS7458848.1 hypothetical protein [Coralloluteibacterium stylophorae]
MLAEIAMFALPILGFALCVLDGLRRTRFDRKAAERAFQKQDIDSTLASLRRSLKPRQDEGFFTTRD